MLSAVRRFRPINWSGSGRLKRRGRRVLERGEEAEAAGVRVHALGDDVS